MKEIEGDKGLLFYELQKMLSKYHDVVLMEGSTPILRFESGMDPNKIKVVLEFYTREGSTYWIMPLEQE